MGPTQSPMQTIAPATSARPPNPFQLVSSQRLDVGKACTLNADCVQDAYCNGSTQPPTCQCLATHIELDGKCEKSKIIKRMNLSILDF